MFCEKQLYLRAYVGSFNDTINTEIKYRKQGYQDGLKKYGIRYTCYLEPDPIEDVSSMLDNVLLQKDEYQALFFENDLLAAEFHAKAIALGLNIPKDLAIIGYDGIQTNHFFKPLLTTIVQPVEQMGRECVHLVMKNLRDEPVNKRNIFDVTLFEGDTTL